MDGMTRPEITVAAENALIPEKNLIDPPPNQFTHVLARPLAYSFGSTDQGSPPDGQFDAGTRVVLLVHDGGARCRVVDGRGLYVEVDYDGLTKPE